MFPFIHIPRTGGTSVIQALRHALRACGAPEDLHLSYRVRVKNGWWDENKFSFTFIRNPWDRLVSWFLWCGPKGLTFERWVLDGMPTHDCSHWFEDESSPLDQEAWFTYDGRAVVSFVGRFESLHDDAQTIAQAFGLDELKLPHLHATRRGDYREWYTPITRDRVGERFVTFNERWGYSFA